MILGRSAEVIVRRVQMKHTEELKQEGSLILRTLERETTNIDDKPLSMAAWLRGVWIMGVYEREMKIRNILD